MFRISTHIGSKWGGHIKSDRAFATDAEAKREIKSLAIAEAKVNPEFEFIRRVVPA